MADDKRIYELDEVTDDLDSVYFLADSEDLDEAICVLGSNVLSILSVSALPTADIKVDVLYKLTVADGYAPIGLYTYDDTGWMCISQFESISLSDWTGEIPETVIYAGVEYTVSVTADVSSLSNITLSTRGIAQIVISNDTLYTISTPDSGYTTTSSGLDDISTANVRLSITLTGTEYEYAATERVILASEVT